MILFWYPWNPWKFSALENFSDAVHVSLSRPHLTLSHQKCITAVRQVTFSKDASWVRTTSHIHLILFYCFDGQDIGCCVWQWYRLAVGQERTEKVAANHTGKEFIHMHHIIESIYIPSLISDCLYFIFFLSMIYTWQCFIVQPVSLCNIIVWHILHYNC